jgi:hypothetical protein
MLEADVSTAAFVPFARAATYTPPGEGAESVSISVILDKEVERWSVGSYGASIATSRDEITFRKAQVAPVRGATVLIGGDSYTLTEVVEDDDIIIIVAAIKAGAA